MMRRALALAEQAAAMGEVPVGAVVYRTEGCQILGEGHNRREADADPAAHAEMLAICAACERRGDWRLPDCTLVVTLEPCAMCAGLVVNARVGRVVYGCDDPKAGACRSVMSITGEARLNHRPVVIAGVLAEEASAILKGFFRELRARRRAAAGEATVEGG